MTNTASLPRPAPRRTRRLGTLLAALLATFGGPAAAFFAPKATLAHGPFEIVAQERRISSGTFPNQGGNPFATRPVTGFTVRWRGQSVEVPGRGDRFWQVLRLPDAPHPALLLVARDFTLVSEQDGQLKVQPLSAQSASLAEAQWLDSEGGQPGESQSWGISHVDLKNAAELDARTRLQGGQWLRLGSQLVLDLRTLAVHKVEPWLPVRPGEPVTGLSRAGDEVRAFSPGRTAYALAGLQYDYARGKGQVWGLLVVDIASGIASELRVDRRRMPFASTDDMDHDWITHYFGWQRDAAGREQLVPRAGVKPRPWRGRLLQGSVGELEYRVPRMRPAFADEVRRIVLALPGAALAPDWIDPKRGVDGFTLRVGDCTIGLRVGEPGLPEEDYDGDVGVFAPNAVAGTRAACNEIIRRIAAAADAELASGRHDRLVVLE
ncbi:MAG: hypothetical protein KF683_21315 [Rubrivivax sp.]|nr:hypothetical protein [Rubrivivax sp.]